MIALGRRSFLAGLASFIAAPAVITTPGLLMPVKSYDPYFTRVMLDYNIGLDAMVLRVDRATVPLPAPPWGNTVTLKEASRWVPLERIAQMRPNPGQQLTTTVHLSPHVYSDRGMLIG